MSSRDTPNADTPKELERKLAADWPAKEWQDTHVLLAVSGGADSVALLRAVLAIKRKVGGAGRLFVGHFNHGLRGPEADADEAWLKDVCCQLAVPIETEKVNVSSLSAEQGDGLEAAARTARYDFLRQTAERLGARYVATAHTANDQVETVLHRILRGTGLTGLAGMPHTRPLSNSVSLVRPMLNVWRREITTYLDTLGQSFRRDTSNDDASHTRNRLRLELLPLIRQQFNANVDSALVQLAVQAHEAQRAIESLAADVISDCVALEYAADQSGRIVRRVEIDCSRLANEPPMIVREVCKSAWAAADWPLQSMGFSEWELLASMAADDSPDSANNLPSNVLVCREGQRLIFTMLGLP